MTGAEIVGGAVVAAKGVKAAADAMGGDADERKQLARLGEGLPAMSQAAQAKAHRVAIRQKFLTKCMAPLAVWVGHKIEYFDPETGQFANDLAEKMADVPEESIISPAPVVAAQSIEGLSYSLDEPDLKEMYLNLLATASDGRRAREAHPSYAQMIKQLAPDEARLLKGVLASTLAGGVLPIAELRNSALDGSGGRLLRTHLMKLEGAGGVPVEDSDYPAYVDNWIRLGLIAVSYDAKITAEDAYTWIESQPEYLNELASIASQDGRELEAVHGLLRITNLGRKFYSAVTHEENE